MPSADRIEKETQRILKLIQRTPFEQCKPVKRGFANLSFGSGLYAIKSSAEVVLYVGIASAFRTRFQNGHQSLQAMLIEGISPQSIRILTIPLTVRYLDYMLDMERWILYVLKPQYNVRIPSFNEATVTMQLRTTSGHLADVLKFLPAHIVDALEDHADVYGLTDNQVLELAIAQFLDLDSINFGDRRDLKGVGALRAENEILKLRLRAAGLPTEIDAELPDPEQN
jgi:hypothetical protein